MPCVIRMREGCFVCTCEVRLDRRKMGQKTMNRNEVRTKETEKHFRTCEMIEKSIRILAIFIRKNDAQTSIEILRMILNYFSLFCTFIRT